MGKEIRTVCFDPQLKIEAYRFEGILQKFPPHFHDYYVIGCIEKGQRYLLCKNEEYRINPGDIILFNPGDNHSCEQLSEEALDYRCINIEPNIMRKMMLEIRGKDYLPLFGQNVIYRSDLTASLHELHLMILKSETDFKKEEIFFLLLDQLILEYCDPHPLLLSEECTDKIKTICAYLEKNFTHSITLDELSGLSGMSKYYLLHCFTKEKGISPYSYLITKRISMAKKLLEQGTLPADVAFQTGFNDQSHFSNHFKKLIGLTPKQYMMIFRT